MDKKKIDRAIKLIQAGAEMAAKDRFDNNPFKMFVCDVFCDNSRVIFEDKVGKNLFDDGIDCKQFLEDQFKIKFNNI